MAKNSGLVIGGIVVAIIVVAIIAFNVTNMTGNVSQPRITMVLYDGANPVKIGLNKVTDKVGVTDITKTSAVVTLVDNLDVSNSSLVLKGYDNTERIGAYEVTIVSITYRNPGTTKAASSVYLRLKKVA